METITATDAAAHVSAMVESAIRGECTTITKHGKPKAVVVPVGLYERLWELDPEEATETAIDPPYVPARTVAGVRAARASPADDEPADLERLELLRRIRELEGSEA